MQQLRISLSLLIMLTVGACAPRQPTQPDPLPPTHEEALPAPATDRDGGARRAEPVRQPVPPDTVPVDTIPPDTIIPASGPADGAAPTSAAALPIRPMTGAADNSLRLVVSIGDRELYVYRGDERIRRYDIAVGQPDHPTPTGEFTIHQVDWNPDWTPPESEWAEDREPKAPGEEGNPMGRVRLTYQAPYTIHGTTDLESLGGAESHGSIRMANDDVIELATLVMEAGGEARSESWYDEVLANRTEMVSVTLSDPVPLVNRD
jgi:lipoprotein-anchoring transpeptidase ErfK/SrfK